LSVLSFDRIIKGANLNEIYDISMTMSFKCHIH